MCCCETTLACWCVHTSTDFRNNPVKEQKYLNGYNYSSPIQMVAISKNKIIIFLIIIIALLITDVVFIGKYHLLQSNNPENKYSLLSLYLSKIDNNEFPELQKYYKVNYHPLKEKINSSITLVDEQKYAVYFESLNSGSWIGISERERFASGSLRKVSLLAAVYKRIEEGELTLDTPVTILPQDLNEYSGVLYGKGSGYALTIKELMHYTAYYSDNTAAEALIRAVGEKKYVEAMFNLGLSFITFLDNGDPISYPLSTKEFSSVFRGLYFSSYLTPSDSQSVLLLLSNTSSNSGIPAGVPKNILVSHKTAYWFQKAQHNDCGIVYYPNSPYILCIMTSGMTEEGANLFTAKISKIVYNYVDSE